MAAPFPAKAAPLLQAFLLTGLMTLVVSAISTSVAVGFGLPPLGRWLQAWLLSWATAFPTMLVVMPIVRRIVAGLVEPASPGHPRKGS